MSATQNDSGVSIEEITATLGKIESDAQNMINSVGGAIYNNLIGNAIATNFYGPEIVEFSTNYLEPDTKNLINKMIAELESVLNAISASAAIISNGVYSKQNYELSGVQEVTGQVLEQRADDGFVGVLSGATEAVNSSCETIENDLEEYLNNITTTCQTSGFYGGGVQDQLNSSITSIKNGEKEFFEEVKAGTTSAANGTLDEYNNRLARVRDENLSVN